MEPKKEKILQKRAFAVFDENGIVSQPPKNPKQFIDSFLHKGCRRIAKFINEDLK